MAVLSGDVSAVGSATSREVSIAIARMFLAVACLLAIWGDTGQPAAGVRIERALLVLYVGFAAACLRLVWTGRASRSRTFVLHHLVDVAFSSALALLTDRAGGPIVIFLTYPLFTAVYRWGIRQAFASALLAALLMSVYGAALSGTGWLGASEGPMVPRPHVGLRATYLLIVTGFVGYFADQERQRRAEVQSIARMLGAVHLDAGFEITLDRALEEGRRLFQAREVVIAIHEIRTGRTFVSQSGAPMPRVTAGPISADPREVYLFDLPGTKCHATRRWWFGGRGLFDALSITSPGRRAVHAPLSPPASFLERHPCRRMLIAHAGFEEAWITRLYVIDPRIVLDRYEQVSAFVRVAEQVGPALYDRYLVRRLRSRASDAERRRIVHELHDGLVQSLVGVEIELAVLGRRADIQASAIGKELASCQDAIRHELLTLRELLEGTRTTPLAPGLLREDVGQMVARFSVYSGIWARFLPSGPPVSLRARGRRDSLRIAQEALVNVRKHGRATQVTVFLSVDDAELTLAVEDNGVGFAFEGTLDATALRATGQGPATILERAEAIGATVTVTSRSPSGSRVEVRVPLAAVREARA